MEKVFITLGPGVCSRESNMPISDLEDVVNIYHLL